MDSKQLLRERKQLVEDVYDFKQPSRIPTASNFYTWAILDAGYTMHQALYDYDLMEKIFCDFHKKYQFDVYIDLGTRNMFPVTDALGAGFHVINETDDGIYVKDHHLMERDEYQELIDDPNKIYWEKFFKRYCKPDITIGELRNGINEFLRFQQFAGRMNHHFVDEYGTLQFYGPAMMAMPAFDTFFNILRGLKDLSLDMRKCKDLLAEACEKEYKLSREPGLLQADKVDASTYVAPLSLAFLGHTIMNNKQFEMYYLPSIQRVMNYAVEHHLRVNIFCEGSMLRYAEYFQDIPKGTLMICPEQDDIFELREKLPNVAICGGMPTVLLGHGTKQECIDHVRNVIDRLGTGIMFCQDKMVSFRNDAKSENILAVNEFLREYHG